MKESERGRGHQGSKYKCSLYKALLFIYLFLQQQITEAVLKIKVSFFCKKNLHKILRTVQNEAIIYHLNEGHDYRKSVCFFFSMMKTCQYLYISELLHIII